MRVQGRGRLSLQKFGGGSNSNPRLYGLLGETYHSAAYTVKI